MDAFVGAKIEKPNTKFVKAAVVSSAMAYNDRVERQGRAESEET